MGWMLPQGYLFRADGAEHRLFALPLTLPTGTPARSGRRRRTSCGPTRVASTKCLLSKTTAPSIRARHG